MKTRIQLRNEARILDAAQEVFATYGYQGATIDEVAERAGISKPNLHYYFKRKRDLYLAVLRRTLAAAGMPAVTATNPLADPHCFHWRFGSRGESEWALELASGVRIAPRIRRRANGRTGRSPQTAGLGGWTGSFSRLRPP